jgi:hypothetical protein
MNNNNSNYYMFLPSAFWFGYHRTLYETTNESLMHESTNGMLGNVLLMRGTHSGKSYLGKSYYGIKQFKTGTTNKIIDRRARRVMTHYFMSLYG